MNITNKEFELISNEHLTHYLYLFLLLWLAFKFALNRVLFEEVAVDINVVYSGDVPSQQLGNPQKNSKFRFLTKGIFQKVIQAQHLSELDGLGLYFFF